MPASTMIICAAIVATFLSFAGVLAWGDYYTSKRH